MMLLKENFKAICPMIAVTNTNMGLYSSLFQQPSFERIIYSSLFQQPLANIALEALDSFDSFFWLHSLATMGVQRHQTIWHVHYQVAG